MNEFKLKKADFWKMGRDLKRPECVLALPDGGLLVSDKRATATRIHANGDQTLVGPALTTANGLALGRDGTLFAADIDGELVYQVSPDGSHRTIAHGLTGAVNFVYVDPRDRLWVTVSTRTKPRPHAVNHPIPDGYVALVEQGTARVVAEGICFTNEVRFDAAGDTLYVAETATGRVLRAKVDGQGVPGKLEYFAPELFPGSRIDGICFDEDGYLWITEITRNGIHTLSPDGEHACIFEDPGAEVLNFPTSIAFGGADRTTAYVGSLNLDHIVCFKSPRAGLPMQHWIA